MPGQGRAPRWPSGNDSGHNTLNYSLYTDPRRTNVWGNTIGTNTVTGIAQDYTVYGRIPPQTIFGPGPYSDTIVVTLTF